VAAALVMSGGLATTVMAGTSFAGPIIFTTTTSITAIGQAQVASSSDPVVTVDVSVKAGGGNTAPTGEVTVGVAGQPDSCRADLTSSSGVTSSGSCELRDLTPGSYKLQAEYAGATQYGKSASGEIGLTVNRSPGQNAAIGTHLSCPAAVDAGQSGNCKLTVTNKGPGTAVNVVAEIALPSALQARYCGSSWWWGWNRGCSLRHNDATWHLGNLKAWQVKSETVHFTAAGNRWSRNSHLVTVTGSATWGVNFGSQGPMQHVAFSKYRVEIRPWGFRF
jgi:hypothetical protein